MAAAVMAVVMLILMFVGMYNVDRGVHHGAAPFAAGHENVVAVKKAVVSGSRVLTTSTTTTTTTDYHGLPPLCRNRFTSTKP